MERNPWRSFAAFCLAVARRLYEERMLQAAGALTFTTLLSLVPAVIVAVAVATAFPVFDQAIDGLEAFLLDNFLPDAAGVGSIVDQIALLGSHAGRLTAIGLAFCLVTALMTMITIDIALNRLFRVERHRPLLRQVLIYLVVLTLGPALVGGSLSMTSFALGASFGWLELTGVANTLVALLPFVFTCAALALLYAVVPFKPVRLVHALAGGILAGIAFELAKRGFTEYLKHFPAYTLVYGAFATIPIFLVWLYLSWMVVLAGAAFTAMLPEERKP